MKVILIILFVFQNVIAQNDSTAGISETAAELYQVNFWKIYYYFVEILKVEKNCLFKIIEMCEFINGQKYHIIAIFDIQRNGTVITGL